MRTQFIVQEFDKIEREKFYNYINKTFNLDIYYPFTKEYFIKSNFPFVIDFKEKKFWIVDSITCCACASEANVIYSINEFKKRVKSKL